MSKSRRLEDYPDVLSPEDLMTVLSIGRNTTYKMLKNGEIRAVRIGKQYRIPKIALQKFLESCYNDGSVDNSDIRMDK